MSDATEQTASNLVLGAAEPQLFVMDIARSCDFYTEKLGFTVNFLYGKPPFYGQVGRDGARLNLRHVDAPLVDQARREREDYLSASINVNDVERLYAQFQAAGVPFHQHLRKRPWGATTFIVRDPHGNLLLFA
jgi:catechol 2,3-dioxygenase-like lactoylglutathione lyase family enzyme